MFVINACRSVAGGFLADAKGWRWVFWLLVIISGFLSIVFLIFMRETYAPVILQKKVRRLQRETGNNLLRSKLDIGLSPRDYFNRGIVRPFKMLFFSPIIIIFALYMAVVYGYLYLVSGALRPQVDPLFHGQDMTPTCRRPSSIQVPPEYLIKY